ncbi:MAG: LLM class flavin-dependent oxidoreductase [Ilumatobacter sp.]|uniref:LLM class flavin-dependent oxidoreductase n=1 Tax=Ilumatobacter sp. TaxID=1967498 RepID=UPI003297198C
MDQMRLGMCFPRELPAPFVREVAQRLEADGLDQLWVIEDCFFTAAPSLAATAFAVTDRLEVGIGILPAVARNAAVTAMELGTLAQLAPGRLIAGIGHGVQEWMQQMGARPESPLTAFDEVVSCVGRLLAGESVTFDGRHVQLTDVALQPAPDVAPPLLAGVRGPKSLALAGRIADGLVLADCAGPTHTRASIARTGRSLDPTFRTCVFASLCLTDDRAEAHRLMAPFIGSQLAAPWPGIDDHPHIDEIRERHALGGIEAIATMPTEWWHELGAIGDLDDVVEHAEALRAAGVTELAFFPGPTVEFTRDDLDAVSRIRAALH